MSQLVIASQLDEDFNEVIRQRLSQTHPEARVIGVPAGVPSDLPGEVSILLARPINVRGYQAPDTPPPGWPYGLQWIQVVSSGIDFYPQWLFNGPPVSTSRGSAAENIAEFALAAIFAAAKHLPDIWVHDAQWNFTALTPLKGTTLGILGFGAIGRSLATKAHALGINVVALRQSQTPFEVGQEAVGDLVAAVAGDRRGMGRQAHPRMAVEGMAVRQGFGLGDVQRSQADAPAVQRL